MLLSKTSSLLVVAQNETSHNVVGILTDRDYLKIKAADAKLDDEKTIVGDVMTPTANLVSVGFKDAEQTCIDLMAEKEIRHLPVIENRKLQGILTFKDFMSVKPTNESSPTLLEQDKEIIVDDYSFCLTDEESERIKEQFKVFRKK